MKLSRSYVLGLGSGLILSALIAMLLPLGNIHFGEAPGVIKNQDVAQSGNPGSDTNAAIPPEEKPAIPSSPSAGTHQKLTDLGDKGTLIIPAGASAEKIADVLLSERWITSREEFLTLVKQKDLARTFKAGSFELSRTMGIEEIINQLIK